MDYSTAIQDPNKQRRHWLADHPGILTRIARECKTSQQYVTEIFHGRRPGKSMKGAKVRIQLELRSAPGFEKR